MVAASRVFYPESARRDVRILETRVELLRRAIQSAADLNPSPLVQAILTDALESDDKRKWR